MDPSLNKTTGRQKFYGILGLDSIRDEDNNNYKILSPKNSKENKVMLKKEYAYGLDEKLFTPKNESEKLKHKFTNFIKKLDIEIKLTDKYLEEKELVRAVRSTVNS
jgi:hypothetical protein